MAVTESQITNLAQRISRLEAQVVALQSQLAAVKKG